ncbi:hypothetical protein BC938DRAFT_481459 [Jimgerdemannia flammicorona]|uniref:non-specific serine/threonine protein kinase n=1 Tax=Jimgerdemannia flammicorona TaxID=994334 RepID=A0A433QG27_9FUNG|nr:hypothetical protein BC938DRAFT_481459 [Jimgerdemannia flammicorona]
MVNPCTPTPQQFDPRSDLNGRTFRNYCPTGIWHEGTCHVVHKANKLTTAELVAIKFYRNNTAMYKTEKDMLKIIRKSNPKNVIRIFDFVDEDPVCPGYNYMVMEYCKCDLAHFVQKQETPLDTQYVKYIIKSILEGIQACHDAKIVHCDIKPKNLMLFSDDEVLQGVWKLGDFDSARRRGQSINSIITIDYTAPEVVVAQHRRRVPAKAECEIDVFALGMLLFYVVVRDTYWDVIGVTGDAKLDKLADSTELTVSNTAVQEDAIQEIIRGLIQKQPGKRTSLKQLRKNPWFTGATSKLEGMVKEIQKDQKEVLRNQEDLLQGQEELKKKSTVIAKFLKAQEKRTGKQLTVIFDELRSMRSFILEVAECTVPRVFIVKPMNRELKDPRSWLTQPFRLHLLCEEGFHLTPHEGYVVKKPLEFLKAYGTYIKLGVWLLLLGAKIAMHGVVPSDVLPETLASLLNDEHIDFIEQADNLTQTVDDYIDKKSEEMSSYTWKGRVSTNGSSYQVLQGQALKNFQAFLEKTDPSFRYGNLERGQHRKTGKMVWVCTQHRTLLNPLSDQESSPARPQAHHLGSTTSTISFSSTSSSSTISLRSEIKTLKKKADKHAANIQDMAAHEHLNKAICRKVAKKVLNAQETLKVMLDGLELDNGETDTMRTQQLQNMCGTLNGYSTILEELELFVKNARGTGGLLKRIFAMNKRDEFDR